MMLLHLIILFTISIPSGQWSFNKDSHIQPKGLSFAEQFENLPYFKTGTQTYQNSSTDPAEDQFNDFSHWLYNDKDNNAVLVDINGPGCIYRIWSTGNDGDSNRIMIYLDGDTTARINESINNFHNHPPLRDKPQVGAGGDKYLAWWSYMPIAFQKSCKIVRKGNFRPFYNITYHTYSDNISVKTWNGKEDYTKIQNIWNNQDIDPKSTERNIVMRSKIKLPAGKTATIFDYKEGGYIASLKISGFVPDKNFKIKMYWDDEKSPSVNAPVKWFFGSVDKGGDVHALGIGTVNNNGHCYYPMPFWKNAKIELENLTNANTDSIDIEIQYNKNIYDENECGYFHAKANETDKPGEKYTCLKTTGRGHVIGMAKRMPEGGHACEADETYFIDNRHYPDIFGTGEEDYANCAWWRNSYNSYPTHGCVGHDCYYRIHFPDMIVYEQALDMEFEAWENFYIASVVWYYEKDKTSLLLTDSLNVMNPESEKQHNYKVTGLTWSGKKEGQYPGKRIYNFSVSDDGRTFNKYSEFDVKVNRNNKGIRLRVRTENQKFQAVKVLIDGVPVEERPWILSKNYFNALWVDADFEIPAKYTKNKGRVNVRLEHIPSYNSWTEYNYQVFSYE
jgi:hypothetical protein